MTLAKQYPYLSSEDWKRIERDVMTALPEELAKSWSTELEGGIVVDTASYNQALADVRQALHSLIGIAPQSDLSDAQALSRQVDNRSEVA